MSETKLPTIEEAIAAGDGTLLNAIDYWQEEARLLRAERDAALAEVERLRAELIEQVQYGADQLSLTVVATQRLEAVEKEVERLRTDAMRYQQLRAGAIGKPAQERTITEYPSAPWVVRLELDHGMPAIKAISGVELDAALAANEAGRA